jgi:hypothetical protein
LDVFTFGEHEMDLTTLFVALPNLSTAGRVRLELNSKSEGSFSVTSPGM